LNLIVTVKFGGLLYETEVPMIPSIEDSDIAMIEAYLLISKIIIGQA
jgi:hypothetical protein